MSIKLFTHNDLDGIGCAILAILSFDKVDIEYCSYGDINEKVELFIKNNDFNNYNHVYITDISISEGLASQIESIHPNNFKDGFNLNESFTLIDHHPTSEYLEKYWWCNVKIENEKGKCSGTSLFYEHILSDIFYKNKTSIEAINDFVEMVRQYDTWEWKTIFNNERPNQLNNLFWLYGREKFVCKTIEKLKSVNKFEFDEMDIMLLEIEKNKKEVYFDKKSKELIKYTIGDYNTGIVFAEQYISELGNYLAEKFSELDFIILIGNKTISYRGVKDNIDLGAFAKQFGGGGHPKSSGSQIDSNKQMEYIKNLFS